MEEEDKDAFQEEERAGESFLQPSSKSRFEYEQRKLFFPCHIFCLMQVHPEEKKEKTRHGGQ